jgi:hypothetical protein
VAFMALMIVDATRSTTRLTARVMMSAGWVCVGCHRRRS